MANVLSRQHTLLSMFHSSMPGFATFAELYGSDPFFAIIFTDPEQSLGDEYSIHDAFLFHGLRLCVPKCSW